MSGGRKPQPLAERFWAKVDKNGPTPKHCPGLGACWLWTAHCAKKGYGQFHMGSRIDGTMMKAHRVAWFIETGRWPKLHVLHKCDNPSCVRPSHLFLGTDADNSADKIAKGRQASTMPTVLLRGEQRSWAKLTEADVPKIFSAAAAGESQRSIAKRFGVSRATVRDVLAGRKWKHVARAPVKAAAV